MNVECKLEILFRNQPCPKRLCANGLCLDDCPLFYGCPIGEKLCADGKCYRGNQRCPKLDSNQHSYIEFPPIRINLNTERNITLFNNLHEEIGEIKIPSSSIK